MRHLRALIIAALLIVLLIAVMWHARTFFLQNKVKFLLNQKQYSDAVALVDRLTGEDPKDVRNQFLRIKALALTEKYSIASRLPLPEDVIESEPEVLYWKALAHWQLAEDNLAQSYAQTFVESGAKLHESASMLIADNLAGKKGPLPVPENDSRSFRLLFPLEQAVYLGLAARQEMELGRMERAAQLFGRAFSMGNRNKGTLLAGAEASALSGNVQQAEMLLAFSGENGVQPLFDKLLAAYEQFKTTTRTIHDQEVAGRGGRVDLARALSWAAGVYLTENVTGNMYPVLRIMADLQQEYPYDRIVTSRMAVILETLKRYDEAYALYKKLYNEAPNLVTGLRMWWLEAIPESELSQNIQEFMKALKVVDVITPAGFTGMGFHAGSRYLAIHGQGTAQTVIKVPENGNYLITLISRGDKAREKWPLIKITVNGEFVDYRYIRREAWDCYSLNMVLNSGLHEVEIEFVNGNKDAKNDTEVRSFYLRGIYVTSPGVV